MNNYIRIFHQILFCTIVVNSVFCTIIDNRYFPTFERVFSRSVGRPSRAGGDIFFMTAKHALNRSHEKFGLPEIYGCFDQVVLGRALEKLGKTNPLRADLQRAAAIPWRMEGKIQAEGFEFLLDQSLNDYFSWGFSTGFMQVNSSISFTLLPAVADILKLNTGGLLRVDKDRREMFEELALEAPQWGAAQLIDSEVFLRVGKIWDYQFKTRRIDLNAQIGCLVPTGQKRDENNPASIPFSGDGHWGISGALALDFELKEDLSFGICAFTNKRFSATRERRMPILTEPRIFGAILGCARITPGFTVGFSPYLVIEGLRDGLGCYARYFYAHHLCDVWEDMRLNKSIAVHLDDVQETSRWVSEYFSFNIFYDFGKTEDEPRNVPRASVVVDIPVNFLGASLSSRTYRVSVGFEVYF